MFNKQPELEADLHRKTGNDPRCFTNWCLFTMIACNELLKEWFDRKITSKREIKILTAEIARTTFGLTPSQHKKLKQLKRENLRDHLTGLELAFTILGEAATTEITRQENAQGFTENQTAARKGGRIAGNARRELEAETGKPVISSTNYLEKPQIEQEKLPAGDEDDLPSAVEHS